jgi:hypothetical protein
MRAEVGSVPGGDHAVVQRPSQHDALDKALAELGEAIAHGRAQHVCSALQALRAAARQTPLDELFDLADRALGVSTRPAVVAAYSRRGCFMCTDGSLPCDQCDGTGQAEQGRDCPHCDGTGTTLCGFCNGTSWADRETVPTKLRQAVLDRQLQHVRRQLRKLNETLPQTGMDECRQWTREQRRQLLGWLRRLQARARDLGETEAPHDQRQRAYLREQADKIEQCMKALQPD